MKTLQQILRQILQLVSSLRCNIYGIIDPRNPQEYRYVGKTPYLIEKRLQYHIYEAKQEEEKKVKTHKCYWIRKLLKEGVIPTIVIIDRVPLFQWKYWEKHYIKHYKNLGHRLTNATDGGEGLCGWVPTKETLKLMSIAKLGNKCSEETIRGMSGKNSPNSGRVWSKETRKLMSEAKLGKPRTQDTRDKISKTLTDKMVGKNHPMYSKTWEEMYGEEKANKMKEEKSKNMTSKTFPNGYKKKLNKNVIAA